MCGKKMVSILPFVMFYMIRLWSRFIIHMITVFKGYADDIFHVIYNFHIYRSKFGGKTNKLGRNCWTPRGLWGRFFQLQGPLVLGGARLPPSVNWSGFLDCQGKVKGQGLGEHWMGDLWTHTKTFFHYFFFTPIKTTFAIISRLKKKILVLFNNVFSHYITF